MKYHRIIDDTSKTECCSCKKIIEENNIRFGNDYFVPLKAPDMQIHYTHFEMFNITPKIYCKICMSILKLITNNG